MKKLLFIVSCLLISSTLLANGPNMWLSGKIGMSSYSDDNDEKITMGYICPQFGYNINENIAVGIGIGYESTKEEYEDFGGETIKITNSEVMIMPFFRYYKEICDKLKLYGEVHAGFGSGKEDNSEYDEDDTYSFFGAGIAPGIQFWPCEKWSFSASIGALNYTSYNDKGDYDGQEDFKASEFDAGLNFKRVRLGLNFHF